MRQVYVEDIVSTKKVRGYTQYAWEGVNYEETKSWSVTEIAKMLRKRLKKEYPDFKFSVRTEYFAGGAVMSIYLMEAPAGYVVPGVKYEQINEYYIGDNNCLTEKGKELIRRIKSWVDSFNYDDSDGAIDYFDTRFYTHYGIGRWDKAFRERV